MNKSSVYRTLINTSMKKRLVFYFARHVCIYIIKSIRELQMLSSYPRLFDLSSVIYLAQVIILTMSKTRVFHRPRKISDLRNVYFNSCFKVLQTSAKLR